MDYSCTAGVYYTLTTRILLLVSLWWYTAQRCWWFPSSHQDHPLMKESINPVSRIYLSHYCASRQGWKTFLHRDNHVWMGRTGLEPAEPEGTRFTVWPATNYGIPSQNRHQPVSNIFVRAMPCTIRFLFLHLFCTGCHMMDFLSCIATFRLSYILQPPDIWKEVETSRRS